MKGGDKLAKDYFLVQKSPNPYKKKLFEITTKYYSELKPFCRRMKY